MMSFQAQTAQQRYTCIWKTIEMGKKCIAFHRIEIMPIHWYPLYGTLCVYTVALWHPRYGRRREKTCLRGFANNTGADQPAHPRSLISAFVVRFLESIICKLATGEISIFRLVSVAEEISLKLALSETPKTGFLATRPIWYGAYDDKAKCSAWHRSLYLTLSPLSFRDKLFHFKL